jgi:hypothetical protein
MSAAPEVEPVLATPVSVGGAQRRFGELTVADVRAHAATLGEATGFGHRSRVGAVAAAWKQLAGRMEAESAATVDELDSAEVESRAEALWIRPPGGSLLP